MTFHPQFNGGIKMAMPTYENIRANYLNGLWNDRMLKTALTCKTITKDQYEQILADKAAGKTA